MMDNEGKEQMASYYTNKHLGGRVEPIIHSGMGRGLRDFVIYIIHA